MIYNELPIVTPIPGVDSWSIVFADLFRCKYLHRRPRHSRVNPDSESIVCLWAIIGTYNVHLATMHAQDWLQVLQLFHWVMFQVLQLPISLVKVTKCYNSVSVGQFQVLQLISLVSSKLLRTHFINHVFASVATHYTLVSFKCYSFHWFEFQVLQLDFYNGQFSNVRTFVRSEISADGICILYHYITTPRIHAFVGLRVEAFDAQISCWLTVSDANIEDIGVSIKSAIARASR